MPKKILVISMTVGSGHVRAAEALAEYARVNLPDFSVEHLDAGTVASPVARLFNQKLYELSVEKFPKMWGRAYTTFDKKTAAFALGKASQLQVPFSRKLTRYLEAKRPSAVIFTYVGIAQMLAPVCKKAFPFMPQGIVVTDYHGHSFYSNPLLDYFFVADDFVKKGLVRAGVDPGKIAITGIPVNPQFYASRGAQPLKAKYGLDNGRPIVLLMPSSLAREDLDFAIGQLVGKTPRINLVVIASGNTELFESLQASEKFRQGTFTLIYWTEAMHEYMAMADAVISKPGGLTVSECVTLGKPMVIVNPIPGQEEYNAKYMVRHRLGIVAKRPTDIAAALATILRRAKRGATKITEPKNSCKLIFDHFQ